MHFKVIYFVQFWISIAQRIVIFISQLFLVVVVNFRRTRARLNTISILGKEVEVVEG